MLTTQELTVIWPIRSDADLIYAYKQQNDTILRLRH